MIVLAGLQSLGEKLIMKVVLSLGKTFSDVYTTDVTQPLKLVDKTTYHYDENDNVIKRFGPERRMSYDEDYTYVPALENITTTYKYKYDQYGNWVEQVEIIDNNINSYEKRVISYH